MKVAKQLLFTEQFVTPLECFTIEDYLHVFIIQYGDYTFAPINLYMPQENAGIEFINALATYVQSVTLDFFLLGGDFTVTLTATDLYNTNIDYQNPSSFKQNMI